KGNGPRDFTELCIDVSANMLYLAGFGKELDCKKSAAKSIEDGSAFNKFVEMIAAQGGDTSVLFDTDKFEKAKYSIEVLSEVDGYVKHIQTEQVGIASLMMGAGRLKKEDAIDHSAGIILNKKPGDKVHKGESLATLYTNDKNSLTKAEEIFHNSIEYSDTEPKLQPVVYMTVDKRDLL
ncbi:MAG: thymidine phosphorylase, partial [Clostridia bacterium]